MAMLMIPWCGIHALAQPALLQATQPAVSAPFYNLTTDEQNTPNALTSNRSIVDESSEVDKNDEQQTSSQKLSIMPDTAAEPLSAEQIFALLQQNTDAIVELKSLMAEFSLQEGIPLQVDAISDQMLYAKIAASEKLRANITMYLRARGYISSELLESSKATDVEAANGYAQGFFDEDHLDPSPRQVRNDEPTTVPGEIQYNRSRATIARSREDHLSPSIPNLGVPEILYQAAPYNMVALRDLYTQLPQQNGTLQRFGSDAFAIYDEHSTGSRRLQVEHNLPLDISPGPDYVVGPGDSMAISLWGGISQNVIRTIDRDGKIALPEAGPVQVAGMTLERVRGVIEEALKHQYRGVQVAITISHLRSIRIYVVGDVQRPGAYDISSLSTSLKALSVAGGPTSVGSMRVLRHYRRSQLIGDIDLYDFLLHGVQHEDRLQSGDTVVVPPVGPQVSVYGAVKRPAIYELRHESTLAAVLQDAGGVTVSAELSHIVIDRIKANRGRETISLKIASGSDRETAWAVIAAFKIRDGDRVHVAPILPYSEKVVYAEGHVVRPGRMPYRDGMQLSDVLHSYRDMLPEPADRGEIVRLQPPDLHPETIEFDVPDVLSGNSRITLKPLDTIRVFGRYETDAPKVTIRGEVLRPGTYDLSRGMTAADLVRMAGGLKRDALLTNADLTSYKIVGGSKVVSERASIAIDQAISQSKQKVDVSLKAGDILTIHQLTGWNDIGSSITVEGEVAHPGSYGFQQGERLSSILHRAGGFRDTSYPAGAVLIRDEVRKLEEKTREELIHQIETSSSSARISPYIAAGDQSATLQLIAQQQNDVLTRLHSQPASGRMVIHISEDISSWENTPADIEVRSGDVLRIPKRPGFVLVSGQVYNASAITYVPRKSAGWYLRRAGGATEIANKKQIFIIRANGSVVGHESGLWLDHDVLSTRLNPGDAVVVPQKIIGASLFWRNLLTVAQITSSIAVTAAVAGVL